MRSDPRANPPIGSEFISGQITDKALALFDLLNQVTGTEGGSYRTFDIEDADPLSLALYRTEPDINGKAWEPSQIIYFQDSSQRLREISGGIKESVEKLQLQMTNNIHYLFDLINESEGDADGDGIADGGITAGDPNKSILQEITDIANSEDAEPEDIENAIQRLLTGDDAINNLINTLFERFALDVEAMNNEIFQLLNDGDDIFSNTGDSDTDTTEQEQFFLSFGNDQSAVITDDLDEATRLTLEFLKERHEDEHGIGSWNEDYQISLMVANKFQNGSLLLDPNLIDRIIKEKNISDEELKGISSQRDFLRKFANLQEFLDFASTVNPVTTNDTATIAKLFKQDLAARTPKYYEDQRSLLDILKGKSDDYDSSNVNRIFQSAKDKIEAAAMGAVQALGSGFDTLATNNYEAFVRDNPILVIEKLIEQRSTATSTDELNEINKKITALKEFHSRQLNNFNSWFKEKSKRLAKAKLLIRNLETEKNNSNTSAARQAEIDAKIAQLINNTIENDPSLDPAVLRSRAAIALSKLEEIKATTSEAQTIASIDQDIQTIQNTLLADDANLSEAAIRNGAALIINKTTATDLADINKLAQAIGDNPSQDQSLLDQVKLAYGNHDFLELPDSSGFTINDMALEETLNTVIRTKNTHAALYASETLEAGKINARYTSRKLSTPDADGNLPEDNQLAPPEISPTPSSAAIAAIGNQILLKANNLINETNLPDETWINDNVSVLQDINNQIALDPSLANAGAAFHAQLKELFKVTISQFISTHTQAQTDAIEAKAAYRIEKNLNENGNIGGRADEFLDDLDDAFDWLDTSDAATAIDRIFIDTSLEKSIKSIKNKLESDKLEYENNNIKNQNNVSRFKNEINDIYDPDNKLAPIKTAISTLESYIESGTDAATWNNVIAVMTNDIRNIYDEVKNEDHDDYFKKKGLLKIQERLMAIDDGNDPSLDNLNRDINDARTLVSNLEQERTDKVALRTALLATNPIDPATQSQIDALNIAINALNGTGANSIAQARTERDTLEAELTTIQNRARSLLNGNSTRVGINNLINHITGVKDAVIADLEPALTSEELADPKEVEKRLKQHAKELAKEYSDQLIGDDALINIQEDLISSIEGTNLDINKDNILDFTSINNVIDRIDSLAYEVGNIFGDKDGKAQILGKLENALTTKQSLEAELAASSTSAERRAEIEKTLYGFETIENDNGSTTTIVGTADNLKDKSLLATIEELKPKAEAILGQELPEDETELAELLHDKKGDFASIEQQSIKRLILLMFVLSMLEYSDWEYRKLESDPSRYAVT